MKNNITEEPIKKSKMPIKDVFYLILLGGMMLLWLIAGVKSFSEANNPIGESTKVENIFLDINGDGLLDYVISAEYIENNGNLNLTQGQ